MQILNRYIFFLLLVSISFPYSISGFIKNSTDGEPIPFANIILMDSISEETLKGTSSDINGYFILTTLTSNEYVLNISIIGFQIYKQKIIIYDENIRVDISLIPQPISLDEVSISSERTRFEEKV